MPIRQLMWYIANTVPFVSVLGVKYKYDKPSKEPDR